MFFNSQITTFTVQNEHVFEHDFTVKKNFSNPKIYTANGDLKKRWYVYFSFRNPDTGKLQRMKNIYGVANNFKTKEDRLMVLTAYRRNLLKLLKEGFNPFEDNTALFEKRNDNVNAINSDTAKNDFPEPTATAIEEVPKMNIKEAFDFALTIKKSVVNDRTYRGYSNRVKNLLDWLTKNRSDLKNITDLKKSDVQKFLNSLLQDTSARNRNNFRVDLSSLMQTLEDNEIIPLNFIKSIPILKTTPERNKTYSKEVQENIYKHLEEKDTLLLLYIKFISYNFLRPIEVCRIQIKDINLPQKTIQFKAKNKALKTKIIPDILIDELPDLSNMEPNDFLFTPDKLGGTWEASENNKRDYFSKRFKRVVKDPFHMGKDYGLYSFRHTYITKLYRELVKGSSPFEAKSKLMLITGHTTMTALDKYLRDIDATLPSTSN